MIVGIIICIFGAFYCVHIQDANKDYCTFFKYLNYLVLACSPIALFFSIYERFFSSSSKINNTKKQIIQTIQTIEIIPKHIQ